MRNYSTMLPGKKKKGKEKRKKMKRKNGKEKAVKYFDF